MVAFLVLVLLVFALGCLLAVAGGMLVRIPWTFTKNDPPYIPSRKAIIPYLEEIFSERNSMSHVFDLGAGDGRIIAALEGQNAEATYVGVEKRWLPYLLSILWWKGFRKRKRLYFKRENIYRTDLREASHIYAYLFPGAMDTLLPKLREELPEGAILASLDFSFSEKEPERVIDVLPSEKNSFFILGKKIFVYRF